ncbi:MAG: putative DNA binding domain-containing protein [Paludibacteraceae bacterium]|nr:putative DNA binding domain-containing protein [Paludibacteraceae bacterium]
MNIVDILKIIDHRENDRIEFKSAKGGFPQSFWSTFSAFANTNGGVIVLGVKEKGNHIPIIDNLSNDEVEKLKNEFWNQAHNKQKISESLLQEKDVKTYNIGESWILVFEIPRAHYTIKPIFLNGSPFGNTYKRRNEGDYRCTDDEVRIMFSDSNINKDTLDAKILSGYTIDDIDESTLEKYRKEYNWRHEGHPWTELPNKEFLTKIGAYSKGKGIEGITVAGMLMFGKYENISSGDCLPQFFVDYKEHLGDDPNERWSDRIYPDGRWESNLCQFFFKVLNKLYDALPTPFKLNNDGITRLEYSSAHIAVREAFANAIIHANYNSLASIKIDRWKDHIEISNPGSMLVSVEQFYQGQQSVCRNPLLQKMFVFMGIGEKAGSGADVIIKGWKDNQWIIPEISECADPDRVVIKMQLSGTKSGTKLGTKLGTKSSLSWDSLEIKTGLNWNQVSTVFEMLKEPNALKGIQEKYGMSNTSKFKNRYINPLIEEGLVSMTIPDKPTSSNQKYVLSKKGLAVLTYEKSKRG